MMVLFQDKTLYEKTTVSGDLWVEATLDKHEEHVDYQHTQEEKKGYTDIILSPVFWFTQQFYYHLPLE